MNVTDIIIDARGISKSFDSKEVVHAIDMQVARGEIYGFLGPNGSGKTTFIRMLCGLMVPDSGQGTCLGFDIRTQYYRIKPLVGYMPQHFSLYEDLTVRENLDFMARMYSIPNRGRIVRDAIDRMELGPFSSQRSGTLSGGWKQRLSLAACTMHNPKLLLLDEPTAGVDPSARREFWDHIHALAAEGITALITTHYMDEAERCHRLTYIAYGTILASGSVEDIVAHANLTTWQVKGPDMYALRNDLSKIPAISQIVSFGSTLHVSGRNPELLKKTIEPFMTDAYQWSLIPVTLEEVFINLIQQAGAP